MAIEIVDFPSYKLPEGKYSHPSIGVNFDQFFTLHRFPVQFALSSQRSFQAHLQGLNHRHLLQGKGPTSKDIPEKGDSPWQTPQRLKASV